MSCGGYNVLTCPSVIHSVIQPASLSVRQFCVFVSTTSHSSEIHLSIYNLTENFKKKFIYLSVSLEVLSFELIHINSCCEVGL